MAFTLSAFIAAVGGVLLAFRSTAVVFTNFDSLSSISQIGWTVIGGVGFITGPLIGMGFTDSGLLNQLIATVYNDQFSWLPLIGSIGLLVTLLQNPDGIAAVGAGLTRRIISWRGRHDDDIELPESVERVERATPRRALSLRGIDMSFGAVDVLSDVSLTVTPGQVHGLIGPNGAGKTTLLDVISGFVHPQAGHVTLGGESVDQMSTFVRARKGIGRSFQSLELFPDLNVYDNIRAASEVNSPHRLLRDLVRPKQVSLSPAGWEAVRLLDLGSILHRRIDELSYGKRHLVAIARALATDSDVILLDEPAAGLDEVESEELRLLIRRIAEESGIAVLLIEHDVELVMSVSDIVTALSFGRVIASGTPHEVRSNTEVIASYLGRAPDQVEKAELDMLPELGGTV
jgi:ABC-type branched-subunit amino acid transport system ATPase component